MQDFFPIFRVAGNAAYVIGTLAEMDLGKKRIVHIFTERGEQTKRVLPSLTKMLDMLDMETVMNAAGTLGTLVWKTSKISYATGFIMTL